MMSVRGPREPFERGRGLVEHLRLDRQHQHLGSGDGLAGLSAMPRSRQKRVISSEGFGSRTVTPSGLTPTLSQPSSMEPPILPAPTRTRDDGRLARHAT